MSFNPSVNNNYAKLPISADNNFAIGTDPVKVKVKVLITNIAKSLTEEFAELDKKIIELTKKELKGKLKQDFKAKTISIPANEYQAIFKKNVEYAKQFYKVSQDTIQMRLHMSGLE